MEGLQQNQPVAKSNAADVIELPSTQSIANRMSLIDAIGKRAKVRLVASAVDTLGVENVHIQAQNLEKGDGGSPPSSAQHSASTSESGVPDAASQPQSAEEWPIGIRSADSAGGAHFTDSKEAGIGELDAMESRRPASGERATPTGLDPLVAPNGCVSPERDLQRDEHDARACATARPDDAARAPARGTDLHDDPPGGAGAVRAGPASPDVLGALGGPQPGGGPGDADRVSLSIAIPLREARTSALAALLKVRDADLPPQHRILAHPTPGARIDVRALEAEALRLRYGADFDADAIVGDRADATIAIQSVEATKLVRWMADQGVEWPIGVDQLLRYLAHLEARGIVWSGIQRAKYGIEALARACGIGEHVTRHRLVARAMNAVARRIGRAPTFEKAALLPDHLRAALIYYEDLARTEPLRAARDLAVCAFGLATAQRGDEILRGRIELLTIDRLGMTYIQRAGKMIQHAGDQAVIRIGRAPDTRICPVATYERYAEAARLDSPGPLFRGIARDGTSRRSALTRSELVAIVKNVAIAAGLDPQTVSTHSLRIGAANAARRAGLGRETIKRITRHQDDRVLDRYMRPDDDDDDGGTTARLFA